MRRGSSRIKLSRIRDALGSTPLRKKDPQERESRSITPVPLFLLLPPLPPFLTLSLFLRRPPKITRVRLALVASMTKVGRPGPGPRRSSSSPRRRLPRSYLYKWFFIHAAFCSRVPREGISRASRSALPTLSPSLLPRRRRPPSIVSVGGLARGGACAWGGTCSFSYTPAPSAWVSFWYSFGISSRRGDTFGEEEVGYGTRARCKLIGRPVKRIPPRHQPRTPWWNIFADSPLFLFFYFFVLPLFPSSLFNVRRYFRSRRLYRRIIICMLQRDDLRARLFAVRI